MEQLIDSIAAFTHAVEHMAAKLDIMIEALRQFPMVAHFIVPSNSEVV